jgi:type II secretion system protein I
MSRTGRPGFTLIELMLTVVIVAAGLVLILQSLSSGMRCLNRAQNRALAALIAAEKLEELEEDEFMQCGLSEQSGRQESIARQNKDFEVSIEISPQTLDLESFPQDFLPEQIPEGFPQIKDRLQKVAVYVSWQERAAPQQLALITYLNAKQD